MTLLFESHGLSHTYRMTVSGIMRHVAWCALTEVLEVPIALMVEAVSTFETSAILYQTSQRSIPEDFRHAAKRM